MLNEQRSIIDLILENQEQTAKDSLEGKKKTVTEIEFFEEYCSKSELLTLLNKCDMNDLKALEYLLTLMHSGQKFDVTPFERLDNNNNLYIWVNLRNKNTTGGFKVLTAGKMCQFVGIYGFDLITSKLTLEGLYKSLNEA